MTLRRFITGIVALVLASSLSAGTAQALSVDLITNGDFETGDLSGWTTTSTRKEKDQRFVIDEGKKKEPPLSGNYDVTYETKHEGVATLTQFFTVPSKVASATFSFTQQIDISKVIKIDKIVDWADQQFTVSVVDSLGAMISEIYATTSQDIPKGDGTASMLSFDLTSLMQAYAGDTLGIQFSLAVVDKSMTVTLDGIAMMVETPAAVPLPASIWMMLAGLGLFAFLGWKRRDAGNSTSFTLG
ncbi:PEP-CTERM sorting domain-containing protein [Thioclava sp.]|uniref:VPLPA-CTERM sorting domain-containing protein n=1 Tax=Thioclava sp. TaxID=1933450 RepID=UPI003AA99298